MRFVVEETSWVYNHGTYEEYCSGLLSCLEFIQERIKADDFFMSDALFTIEIVPGKTFFDLWDHGSGAFAMPRDVQEVFSVVADRIRDWSLEEIQPESHQVTLDGSTLDAPSVAWCAENQRQGMIPIACVAIASNRALGEQTVTYLADEHTVCFVADKSSEQLFARFEILCVCTSVADLEARAERAFKGLDFRDGVFGGVKDMSKSFTLMLPSIVTHLGVLSDHGAALFAGPAQNGFEGLGPLGVEASDENGKTKGNARAMKKRTKKWRGRDVVFSWHTKIEPDRDRIHFFKDDQKEGRLVIGIFHRHLPT